MSKESNLVNELLDKGITDNAKIKEILQQEGLNAKYDVAAAKYRKFKRGKKVVEGQEEYTPKHELTDDGYKVYYANTYIVAKHEDIRTAFMMYCVGGLTMNQVALKMGWTRAEFNAIKTAFHITKDAPPFTPYEIDKLTADEMAELIRIEKKRYSLAKFEQNKHKDIEKRIKEYDRNDYWVQRFAELINGREERQYKKLLMDNNTDVLHCIKITDEHSGLETHNVFNDYNFEIMEHRFEVMTNWIIENIQPGKLLIMSTGDACHGENKGSMAKHSKAMLTSAFRVTDCYITMFDTLLPLGYEIEFAKSNGSHSAFEKAKEDRVDENNIGRSIIHTLKRTFRKQPEVKIHDYLLDSTLATT